MIDEAHKKKKGGRHTVAADRWGKKVFGKGLDPGRSAPPEAPRNLREGKKLAHCGKKGGECSLAGLGCPAEERAAV